MTHAPNAVRLLIAAGGTGGHVLPAVAVIQEIRSRNIAVDALWVGSHKGVEREIAGANDVPFVAIQTGKIRRYASIETVTDLFRIPVGTVQAWRHVRRFRPDVIYSTGGAVSVPTVIAGSRSAPILTHEQTAQIGIANRTASRFAKTFAVGFEQAAILARQSHGNVVVTGNAVRSTLLSGSEASGRGRFGFGNDLPVIYVTGGARGASPLNTRVEAILPDLLAGANVLHQAGPPSANDDFARLSALKASLPGDLGSRYVVTEFVRDELPDVYAMADLVIGRSGAGTVSELGYVGLPSILIPLPGTWGDEQRKNASVLREAGAAVVLEQADATPERLRDEALALIGDRGRLASMAEAARTTSTPDAAARLVDELLKLAGTPSQSSSGPVDR